MSTLYNSGDRIEGENIFYCFGNVPVAASVRDTRYRGSFQRTGYARVAVQWKRSESGKPVEVPEVKCESARFECGRNPHLRRRNAKLVCGNHTCWAGHIRDDAHVEIVIPLRSHR